MATKTKRGWRPREETLATAEFKRAHAKALEARKKKTCKRGHDLRKPEHVHAGTLLRTGRIMCNTCWLGYAEKSRKKAAAKKSAKPKTKPKAPKLQAAPVVPPPPEVK